MWHVTLKIKKRKNDISAKMELCQQNWPLASLPLAFNGGIFR